MITHSSVETIFWNSLYELLYILKITTFVILLHAVFSRYLIERWEGQCFINVCNNLGKTALHEAAQNCFPETVEYLLECGMCDFQNINLKSQLFLPAVTYYFNPEFYSYILQ
jgi:hypothetical protein